METDRVMVIAAGHGPIPRVAMLSEAHSDPNRTPSGLTQKKGS